MFISLVSNPRVRLSSSTNTQGSPLHRVTILPSQNSSTRVPRRYFITAGANCMARMLTDLPPNGTKLTGAPPPRRTPS